MKNAQNRFLLKNELGKISEKKLEDFHILQLIKKSSQGFVAKVRFLKNNKIYAMKKIAESRFNKDYEGKLKELNHKNIIKYFAHFEKDKCIYIINEYVEGSNLNCFFNINKATKNKIKEEKLLRIFIQCLNGLIYLHSKGLIHGNINAENILIDNYGQIKIINFQNSAIEKLKTIDKNNEGIIELNSSIINEEQNIKYEIEKDIL